MSTPSERYEFEILKGGETLAILRFEDVQGSAMWSRILALAEDYDPGCRIRVTDQSGEMIILVGINAARHAVLLR